MNLFDLLNQLSTLDGAAAAAAPRRQLLRQLGQAGARVALAALPLTLAIPAQAGTTETSLDALVLLLKLEELQVAFYTQALAAPAIAAALAVDLRVLQTHQQDHAAFLRRALVATGAIVPATPNFDFSGRRNNPANPVLFPGVFTDVNSFLQLGQQLEDAAVAIYQGQAEFLSTDKLLLDAVLRMHAVEARHAAHLRTLRRSRGVRVKSWPSNTDAIPSPAILVPVSGSATGSIYTFEANEVQRVSGTATVPYATLLTNSSVVQANALAEAFNEPLPTAAATTLLNIFG